MPVLGARGRFPRHGAAGAFLPVVRPPAGSPWLGSRRLGRAAIVAVVYFAAAKFGLSLASETRQVTAVFPPTGIALAALLLFGPRVWPGVFIGAFVANATSSEAVATAMGIAVGNTAAALVGWYGLRRVFAFDETLGRARDGYALVAVAAVTPLVSATNGVATLALHGVVPWSGFWEVWRVWWVGDALGILLVCPVILSWVRRSGVTAPPARPVELLILIGSCLCVSVVAFSSVLFVPGSHYQLQYAVFPFIIWASLRLGQRVSATLVLGVSAVAIWGAVHGRGPFAAGSVDERLVLLDLFMAVAAVTGLALSAATAEHRLAETRLRASEEHRKALLAAILQAEEQARQRVAVELHDDTIQVLIAALVDLDSCVLAIGNHDRDRARRRIARVRDTLNEAVNRVRRLTFELRPPVLEAHGVGAAVNQMLDGVRDDLGISVERRIDLHRYAPEIEILLFRTTRELRLERPKARSRDPPGHRARRARPGHPRNRHGQRPRIRRPHRIRPHQDAISPRPRRHHRTAPRPRRHPRLRLQPGRHDRRLHGPDSPNATTPIRNRAARDPAPHRSHPRLDLEP